MSENLINMMISDIGKRGLFVVVNVEGMVGAYNKDCQVIIPFEYQYIEECIYKDLNNKEYYLAKKMIFMER